MYDDYEETADEARAIEESLAGTRTDPYLCTICHEAIVDAEAGFDTCDSCLRNHYEVPW